jgi:hypothetical protein
MDWKSTLLMPSRPMGLDRVEARGVYLWQAPGATFQTEADATSKSTQPDRERHEWVARPSWVRGWVGASKMCDVERAQDLVRVAHRVEFPNSKEPWAPRRKGHKGSQVVQAHRFPTPHKIGPLELEIFGGTFGHPSVSTTDLSMVFRRATRNKPGRRPT